MKKLCAIALSFVFAFLFLFSMSVTAASNTYELFAWRVQVEAVIPEEYDVITRDTPSDDPIFRELGATSEDVFEDFKEHGIYLKAISSDNIVVTMSDRVLERFDLLGDYNLPKEISKLEAWYAKYGLKLQDGRLCNYGMLQYLEIYFFDPVKNISALQYYTVYNGRSVSFILYSHTPRLDAKQENTLRTVVKNSRISNAATYTEPEAATEATRSTEPDTSVSVTVPNQTSSKDFRNHTEVIVVVGLLSVALALVLGVAAFWLARTLRRKRDEHKAAKAQRLKQTTAVTNTIRFCRKCGEKLIDNSRFCSRCGTKIVEENNGAEYEEDDVWGTEIEKGNSVKKIILIVSLAFILLAGVVCAALFFMRPKVIPQDIHTINGCPEFYHVEFGMTVDQASKVIQMKHDSVKGMESSSYFEADDFMKSAHILFDEGEVFSLYGIEAENVYVSFDGEYVDGVMFTFDKEKVSYNEIADLYVQIYGPATKVSSFAATWNGDQTTIAVCDNENFFDDGEKTIAVGYTITENSQYTTLSFDGPELDPCDFLGKNNAFDKEPSYYTDGLQEDVDYVCEQFSAGSFANFEKYTLYPRFEYMGIGEGLTAIEFSKDGSENTIGLVSYLFLLDESNAVDRMSDIKKALTQKYGAYSSCTYTSTEYGALGYVDITFDELKQKVGSNTQGIYNVQWDRNGRKITLSLTITADETYYDGAVAYTD